MQAALHELGYQNAYHMGNVFKAPGHAQKWTAALEYKLEGKGEPFKKEQWDDLLGEYDVMPWVET